MGARKFEIHEFFFIFYSYITKIYTILNAFAILNTILNAFEPAKIRACIQMDAAWRLQAKAEN